MPSTRSREIKDVLYRALQLPTEERPAFLDRVCTNDSMRREVESLLSSSDEVRSTVLQAASVEVAITPGTKIADYEVVAFIGAGGMGKVYRAHDRRLRRDVAIKILPPFVKNDPDRLRRFEQEAQAAAALNHPNILAVHQLGAYEGAPYLISELLEGNTLREQLMRGPLPLRKAIDYGVQIARGLAAAHEKGIVHRDLKPENLFVTKDGRVKILDFGLAKLIPARHVSHDTSLTADTGTESGVVMGTVGYMSPEQVRGSAADHRSDVFAFGAILYEMLCGKRAFQKPTSAETMSAILNEDPPATSQIAVNFPPTMQRVVQRCLEKSPEQRFQSASDLAFALEALSDSGSSATRAVSRELSRGHWKWIMVSVVAVLSLAGTIAWYFMPTPQPRITGSTKLTNGSKPFTAAPIVTDGLRLYFTDIRPTGTVLAQLSIKGGDVSVIPTSIKNPAILDISPDHSQLLISTSDPGATPIWALPLPSGSPKRIGDLEVGDAAWSPDGKQLVFTPTPHDLYIANADGGSQRKVMSLGDKFPSAPHFSPDGKRIRFDVQGESTPKSIWEVQVDGANPHQILAGWHNPPNECCGRWTPDGRYYVFKSWPGNGHSEIFALRESRGLFRRSSRGPTRLTFSPLGFFSPIVSPDETKIFVVEVEGRGELVRYDPSSKQLVPFLGGISAMNVHFSRDGKWVAYTSIPDGQLWRSRVDGSERLQLTFGPCCAVFPRWSPDGKSIAFNLWGGVQQSSPKTYLISADGSSPTLLFPEIPSTACPDWSPDGKQLVFGMGYPGVLPDSVIGIADIRTGKVSKIPNSSGMFGARWSPDGRYLLAESFEFKKLLLYDFQTERWKIWVTNDDKIDKPLWTPDGQYVIYWAGGENPAVWRLRLGESKPEVLFNVKDFHLYHPFWALPITIAPDRSVILTRDTSAWEIDALDVEFP